jgi:lysine 2,3-aminomutase
VPIVEGWRIFDAARRRCSGLSRRVRMSMSHESGKIEILGVDEASIYLRFHRAKDPADESRIMVCRRDDEACWLDDLEIVG